MDEPPCLRLISSDDPEEGIDWTLLLEEMDLRDAMPHLRRIQRRRSPAANSALELVADGKPDGTDGGSPDCE